MASGGKKKVISLSHFSGSGLVPFLIVFLLETMLNSDVVKCLNSKQTNGEGYFQVLVLNGFKKSGVRKDTFFVVHFPFGGPCV